MGAEFRVRSRSADRIDLHHHFFPPAFLEARRTWRGGAITELTVMMPVNALAALPRHAEMEQRICDLAATGNYDEEIARILTAEGHRSAWRVAEVLPSTVRDIRLRHGLKTQRQRTRWPIVRSMIRKRNAASVRPLGAEGQPLHADNAL